VVVAIAHRRSTIPKSDCIVVMDHGRIAATGRHEELLGGIRSLPQPLRTPIPPAARAPCHRSPCNESSAMDAAGDTYRAGRIRKASSKATGVALIYTRSGVQKTRFLKQPTGALWDEFGIAGRNGAHRGHRHPDEMGNPRKSSMVPPLLYAMQLATREGGYHRRARPNGYYSLRT
jgi:hypothetical protein